MTASPRPLRWRRFSLAASLLLVVACADGGGSGGCGGCGSSVPYPGHGAILERAVQTRVTPQALRFLENNTGPLLEEFLGEEGLSFCIPPTNQSGVQLCHVANSNSCTAQNTGCLFEAEVLGVALSPRPGSDGNPDGLDARITLTDIDMQIPVDGLLGECHQLRVRSDAFDITARLLFRVGDNGRTAVEIDNIFPDLADLEFYHRYEINDGGVYWRCEAWRGALNTLGPIIAPLLSGLLEQQLEPALCVGCDAGCPAGSSCSGDPAVCRWPSGDCVPLPLGLEGGFDLAGSVAAFGGPPEAMLYYLFYLANYATAERNGLSLGAEVGFHSEYNECVPRRDPPSLSPVPKSGLLTSDRTPQGGTFMVGVGVARRALDLALWSFYNSGALCLTVGTREIEQLTSAALAIILESLADLTEGQNVPITLRVRPTEPPTVALGSGQVIGNPPVILDPLLTVQLHHLEIDFYAYVEERWVRLFTIDTDLDMPLALTPSDDGAGIQILLGDLARAFTRVVAVDAELLAEQDVTRLRDVLPTLVGAFVPQLAGALADPLEIPQFGGYRLALSQDSFTSIENNTMLAIFANLEEAPDTTSPAAFTVMPLAVAELVTLDTPSSEVIVDYEARRRRGDAADLAALRTTVVLAVDTVLDGGRGEREYTYRIDGGPWHLYRPGPTLTVTEPAFLLEGEHTIEVRSRVPGTSDTLSLPSAPVRFKVDLATPQVRLRRLDARLVDVEAWDSAWPSHELSMRWRVAGGDWHHEASVIAVALPDEPVGRSVEVEVEVTDPAGRSTLVRRSFKIHGRGEHPTPAPDDCGSCSAAGTGADTGLWLALLGLLVLRPRRRLLAVLAVLGAAWLAGCSDEPKSTGSPDADMAPEPTCADGCEPDELCINDRCVPNVCVVDDDCPRTMACVDGTCVTRLRCTSEAQCPPGTFCIDDDDDGGFECLSVPCEGNADCGSLPCGGAGFPYCLDGACRCEIPCAEGCGSDQFCCRPTDSCNPLPTACVGLSCDVGFGPAIATPASGDPDSCAVTGPVCECRELPPLPIGDVGAYLSADVGPDGTVYVSAFNRTYEDLMFGIVGEGGTIAWEFVDGHPSEGTVTGSLNGPRGGISDPGTRVGRYTSLAVAGDGVVHIAYYDRSQRTLKYARGVPTASGFSFKLETVDATPRSGMYTSLTLSSEDVPGIAYFMERAEVEPGVWHAQVRYAWADAAEPTEWTLEVVDSQRLRAACGGDCAGTTRCNAIANACQRTLTASRCGGCPSGQQCFDAAGGPMCAPVVPDSGLVYLPEGLGLFADSDRFADDEVALVYYDHTGRQIRFATSAGHTFAEQVPVVLDGDPTTDVGWYPAVTIGPDQAVHVTYVDAQNDNLVYMNVTTDLREIIDAGVRGTAAEVRPVLVGDDSSLVVLPDGTLQVAYMDSTNHDVVVARRSSEHNLWLVPAVVLGGESSYAGAFGFYLQQLVVEGEALVLSYRINTREATRDVVVRTVP
jgi:MYXO-CTERM domain-containing protein